MRIPINELLSLRCGFYEAFSGKIKVIFNGYAMIRTTRYNTKAQREQKPHMRASRETSFQVNRPWKTRQRAKLLCSKLLKEFQRNPVGRHIWKWKGKIWGRCNVQKNLNVRFEHHFRHPWIKCMLRWYREWHWDCMHTVLRCLGKVNILMGLIIPGLRTWKTFSEICNWPESWFSAELKQKELS